MPAASDPTVTLPHTWRPLGVRLASLVFGGALLVIAVAAWIGLSDEIRSVVTFAEKLTLAILGATTYGSLWALSRCKVVAETDRIVVVNGFRERVFDRAEVVAVTLPPGAPWATLDLSDGTSVSAMGIQGSDGDRARLAVRQLRAVLAGPS